MAVSIPASGTASATTGTTASATTTVTVPSAAVAGDVLLILAVSERSEIPNITLAGTTTGLTTARAEAGTTSNLSTRIAWKRLTTTDLGAAVVMTNTTVHRQALAATIVRGSSDPVFTNQAFSGSVTGTAAKTGPAITPTVDNSLTVNLWAIARPVAAYTGYTFTTTATELVEASSTYTSGINPTAYVTARQFATGTANVAQTRETVTESSDPYDSLTTVAVLPPAAVGSPTAAAGVTVDVALIDGRSSVAAAGGALTYTIAPTTGTSQPITGLFVVPRSSAAATYTVTVSEAGGGTAQTTVTVPPISTGSGANYGGTPITLTIPAIGDPTTENTWAATINQDLQTLQTTVNSLIAFYNS